MEKVMVKCDIVILDEDKNKVLLILTDENIVVSIGYDEFFIKYEGESYE